MPPIGLLALVLVSALVLMPTPVAHIPPTPQAPPAPPASGLTELVDFMALGEDGRPVTDLKAADVTLKVDGRPREIRSLELIELASASAIERSGTLTVPIDTPFASNRLADTGRVVLIVIDHESIRPGKERPAKDAAVRFLSSLSPRDLVGLMTMPHGWSIEPTMNHQEIREGLGRITGQSSQQPTTSESLCHARLVLNTLSGMLQALASIDGPKTIAFVSSGLRRPARDAPALGPPGQCELTSVHFDDVSAASSAARAHFYVIQPNDEQPDSATTAFANPSASRFASSDENLAGLQNLAGITGGEIFRLTAMQPDAVFTRVAHESSSYYVIAFEPEPDERNGLAHRVEVRVARERVTVRSAPRYTIAKAETSGPDLTPQRMLRTGRRFRELPLRATAYTSRMPGDTTLKIVAAAEAIDASVTLKSVAVGLFDAKGKLTAQSSADGKELSLMPFVAALPAAVGPVTLRVAAIDTAGRRGTVDYRFRAELTPAIALKLSGLALGVTDSGAFRPRLQFGAEPGAIALFEIYGAPARGAELTVRLELAAGEEGPPLAVAPATVRPTGADDSRIVIGAMPLGAVPPGDYLVRAIVSIDGRPVARVFRTLRKVRN